MEKNILIEEQDEVKVNLAKASQDNIVKVTIQLGGLEGDEEETYFIANFVRHIELTQIKDIKFDANIVKELNTQFNLAIKQLDADYRRSV